MGGGGGEEERRRARCRVCLELRQIGEAAAEAAAASVSIGQGNLPSRMTHRTTPSAVEAAPPTGGSAVALPVGGGDIAATMARRRHLPALKIANGARGTVPTSVAAQHNLYCKS
jgi:hypothetical protein